MIPAFTGSTVSSSSPRSRSSTMNNNMMRGVQQQQLSGNNNNNNNNNNDNNFNGLDDPLNIRQRGVSTSSLLSTIQNPSTQSNDILSPNWENGYYRLVHFDQGIFYENSLIKILFRLKREKTTLSFQLTYSNKSPNTINSLLTEIKPLHYNDNNPPYVIQLLQHPEHLIKIDGKTTQLCQWWCINKFKIKITLYIIEDFEQCSTRIRFIFPKVESNWDYSRRCRRVSKGY
ncbi:unnamed protein product [[Candida] boidinii]|nr:unnamed protein product [[Candida] boidinii]